MRSPRRSTGPAHRIRLTRRTNGTFRFFVSLAHRRGSDCALPACAHVITAPRGPASSAELVSRGAALLVTAIYGVWGCYALDGAAGPLTPLADELAASVWRAPSGGVCAQSVAAALFRVVAVAKADSAMAPPCRLEACACKACAVAEEARAVLLELPAAATAAVGLAASSRAAPRSQSLLPLGRQRAAMVAGIGDAARGMQRVVTRIVAARKAALAVARRLPTAAGEGIARRTRRDAAPAAAAAARAAASAAALMRLPSDDDHTDWSTGQVANVSLSAAEPRASPPTPRAGCVCGCR
eukprot:TRINITY_DN13964_c0_g1_i1.p2 TRINITY_DN13964_c0_g1~~TRINITY_DN13964_c0_g1_i1.p2  ORF type:complete len:297 (-),score=18.43 TRINITY_DN13964_c0_g1_i1:445-1335(-)